MSPWEKSRTHFDLHVVPVIAKHWPVLFGGRFYEKLQIGACHLYASAPYTALFCAPRRPLLVRAVTDLGNALPVPTSVLAQLGRGAMSAVGRFAYPAAHRRIILIASFIVVVDHVFDHCMKEPPEERERKLLRVLRGEERPTTPELALTASFATTMAEGLEPHERAAFDAAIGRSYPFLEDEPATKG